MQAAKVREEKANQPTKLRRKHNKSETTLTLTTLHRSKTATLTGLLTIQQNKIVRPCQTHALFSGPVWSLIFACKGAISEVKGAKKGIYFP